MPVEIFKRLLSKRAGDSSLHASLKTKTGATRLPQESISRFFNWIGASKRAGAMLLAAIPVALSNCSVCQQASEADGRYEIVSNCAGSDYSSGTVVIDSTQTSNTRDSCSPEIEASGTYILGLPSKVRIKGKASFDLFGEVDGRELDCISDSFGDEQILVCRDFGNIACSAIIKAR